MNITRKENKTVFTTRNVELVTEILQKIGLKHIQFIEGASISTIHLNKRLTDEQVKRFRYFLGLKLEVAKEEKVIQAPEIIRGHVGCLVTGDKLRFF